MGKTGGGGVDDAILDDEDGEDGLIVIGVREGGEVDSQGRRSDPDPGLEGLTHVVLSQDERTSGIPRALDPSSPGEFRQAYSFIKTFSKMLVLGFFLFTCGVCVAELVFTSWSTGLLRFTLKSSTASPEPMLTLLSFLLKEFERSSGC